MTDSYLAISEIANDEFMLQRVTAAATQQWRLGNLDLGGDGNNAFNVQQWVSTNRYSWAAAPTWGEKWDYAKQTHPGEPDYEPGKDVAVITDGDILATVQALGAAQQVAVPAEA